MQEYKWLMTGTPLLVFMKEPLMCRWALFNSTWWHLCALQLFHVILPGTKTARLPIPSTPGWATLVYGVEQKARTVQGCGISWHNACKWITEDNLTFAGYIYLILWNTMMLIIFLVPESRSGLPGWVNYARLAPANSLNVRSPLHDIIYRFPFTPRSILTNPNLLKIPADGSSEWVSGTGVSSITLDEWKVVAHEVCTAKYFLLQCRQTISVLSFMSSRFDERI